MTYSNHSNHSNSHTMSSPKSPPIFSTRGDKTILGGRYLLPNVESESTSLSPVIGMIRLQGESTYILSKSEYTQRVQNERYTFLKTYYADILDGISRKMVDDTKRMRLCKIEAVFPIPEPFDRSKVESIIVSFFEFLEYDVIVEKQSSEDLIRLTIQ